LRWLTLDLKTKRDKKNIRLSETFKRELRTWQTFQNLQTSGFELISLLTAALTAALVRVLGSWIQETRNLRVEGP